MNYISLYLIIIILLFMLIVTNIRVDINGFNYEEYTCYSTDTAYPFKKNIVIQEQCHQLVREDFKHFCTEKDLIYIEMK